jgi:hypothetical protein
LEGQHIKFENAVLSGISEILVKPGKSAQNNLVKYIKCLSIDTRKPIYVDGRISLERLIFGPGDEEKTRGGRFIISNAHIEISLNE